MTTKAQGVEALRTELGGATPVGLDRLRGDELQRLADLIATAKAEQAELIADGSARAVRHVPRLLRTPLRRALGL